MLKINCGPFSYLEEALVEHLSAHRPGPGRRVAIVTTSQSMAERLQRLLALERGLSLFNLWFLTLHSLSLDVLAEGGASLPVVINDDLFHERLVEQILLEENMAPDRARALAGAHRATLRDLVEAGVDSTSFQEHFADLEMVGRGKLDRLLVLADRYRDRLEKLNVAGSADLARRAAAVLDERPEVLAGYDELLYYGFYDLNGAQSDFFSAVVRSASVRLFFPCVKGRSGWAFAERFLNLKLPLGGAEISFGTAPLAGVLGPIADHVFDPGHGAETPRGPVTFLNVSGERDEIWRVAKEIIRTREDTPSVAWDEIGVVARGLDGYSDLVQEIFTAHGIPFSLSDGGPLLAVPVVRLALTLAEISFRGHDREALVDILSSPLLRPDIFPPAAVQEARDHLMQAGPRAGIFHLWASPTPANPALKELAQRLKPNLPDRLKSWSAHVTCLRQQMEGLIDVKTSSGFEPLRGMLDRLAEMDRFSPPVSDEDFASTLADVLRRSRGAGTGAVHGVRVRGAMEARGESFRVLFLVGLKEGVFPRVVREDPLLNDDLRRLLRDPGGYWILPKGEGHDEEKLLFTLLLSAAEEKLSLLYSRSREDGRAEVPSLYLRNLARAVGVDLETAERLPRAPLEKWKAVPPVYLTPAEAALVDILEDRRPIGPLGEKVQRAEKIAGWGAPGPWDGVVGPPVAFLDRCATRGLSPSAVETLASCPFEFFLSRLLGLRDPRPFYDEEGLLPFALGSLQHEVLHQVYNDFIAQGVPDPEEAVRYVYRSVRDHFSARASGGAGPYPLLWQTTEDRVRRHLADFVRRDVARLKAEGARPEKLEWALKAPMTGTPFFWTGRVDRVDWSPVSRRWTVVDYKNKKRKEALLKRVLAGQVVQAPAYLEMVAAQKEWGLGAVSAGVRYESLATNETDLFTAEEWALHGPSIEKSRTLLLSSVQNGTFPIRPTEGPGAHCGYCDFARACRKAHGPSRQRGDGGGDRP
ncbi:MAG: PD-(D/E)XK nuclease family protein [Elusimicrobia bacterium]|nr:PD-(D/E)XK nuclease family protein [Elusimicrobiota bacterium]